MISAVQNVNVIRDFWDWVFGCAGAVGGFAGAAALWYAARTRREVAEERARLFELDVIRELMSALDVALASWGSAYHLQNQLKPFARRLSLLPPRELPEWRRVVSAPDWFEQIEGEVGSAGRKAEILARQEEIRAQGLTGTPEGNAEMEALDNERSRVDSRAREAVEVLLWCELEEAAKGRAGANLPQGRRAFRRRHR